MAVEAVEDVVAGLSQHGYLVDHDLATTVFLALRMPRPLLLEGDAGVGKTELAQAIARWTGGRLVRLQCHGGLDLTEAAYDWDHARQLLHLRAAEATGEVDGVSAAELRDRLHTRDFLVQRPLLEAIDPDGALAGEAPPVLLVDEVDRADDAFEAHLLEVLGDMAITVPQLGTIRAEVPPVVVLTSNRTRDLHDALKRRCLYHWVDHPDAEREAAIIRLRVPDANALLARQVAEMAARLRAAGIYKPPGLAESIDWAHALVLLGHTELEELAARSTLSTMLKYHEDVDRVGHGFAAMVEQSIGAAAAAS